MLTQAEPAPPLVVQLPTGVPGLDEVLGGGIPEYSCALLAGGPGTGKTTLAQQILFANTSGGRPGVYFSSSGQSTRKLLCQQQQFSFFEPERVNRGIHYVNLSHHDTDLDPARFVATIAGEVEERRASVVVIDLVRALTPVELWNQLATYLARCEATTLLVGDYDRLDIAWDAAPSTADVVLWLGRAMDGGATGRTIEAMKVRGQQAMPGQHGLRLTSDGLEVFPRWPTPKVRVPWSYPLKRLAVGIDEVDRILGGGVPAGDALLVEGPSGTGKSVLATHFIADGGHQGDPGAVFLFEERPDRFVQRAEAFNLGLERLVRAGMVEVLSFRGRDMTSDEVIAEMQRAVTRVGARRVVIDSVASLELVLMGSRLHDCLWRLLDGLTGAGVTVWLNGTPDAARPSLAPLVDDVLVLQRVEHETALENRMAVTKMRWSPHDVKLVAYQIYREGMQVAEPKPKSAPLGCLFDVPVLGAHTKEVPLAAAS